MNDEHSTYQPAPVDTSDVTLSPDVQGLIEVLAKNAHEVWAQQRIDDGWCYGKARDDKKREHPSLIPYEQLSESEKVYDRHAAVGTLKLITAMGYRIERTGS